MDTPDFIDSLPQILRSVAFRLEEYVRLNKQNVDLQHQMIKLRHDYINLQREKEINDTKANSPVVCMDCETDKNLAYFADGSAICQACFKERGLDGCGKNEKNK